MVFSLSSLIINFCLLALVVFVGTKGEEEQNEKESEGPAGLAHSNLAWRVNG
jgi:hypothetical protein